MLISREMDYTIRIIRQLSKEKICNASQIEKEECISRDFARKILGKLKKAGIVSAERGTNGGYYLTASPKDMTIWDLKNVIEPGPVVNKCLNDGYQCPKNCETTCSVHLECVRIEKIVEAEMQRYSLEEILR